MVYQSPRYRYVCCVALVYHAGKRSFSPRRKRGETALRALPVRTRLKIGDQDPGDPKRCLQGRVLFFRGFWEQPVSDQLTVVVKRLEMDVEGPIGGEGL